MKPNTEKLQSTFTTDLFESSTIQNAKQKQTQLEQTPYHLDGDAQMYTQQNIEKRKKLFIQPQIQKQLNQLTSLYKFTLGELKFNEYKKVHEKIAKIIRPDIEKDELDFVVKQDFEMDSAEGPITQQKLRQLLFDMVDIWTSTVQQQQYLKFIKELTNKLKKQL